MRVTDAKKKVEPIWFNVYENTGKDGTVYENNVAYINLEDQTYKDKSGNEQVSLGLKNVVDELCKDGNATLRLSLKQVTVKGQTKYLIDLEALPPKETKE